MFQPRPPPRRWNVPRGPRYELRQSPILPKTALASVKPNYFNYRQALFISDRADNTREPRAIGDSNGQLLRQIDLMLEQLRRASRDHRILVQRRNSELARLLLQRHHRQPAPPTAEHRSYAAPARERCSGFEMSEFRRGPWPWNHATPAGATSIIL